MDTEKPSGLYLYKKQSNTQSVLKELLQFMRTTTPRQGLSFSYIEASTALHPHLTLWENFQLETGLATWKDFLKLLNPEQTSLVNLLKEPLKKGQDAEAWEKFLVGFLKGSVGPSRSLIIDVNEEDLTPFLLQNFKRGLLSESLTKTIYLATANPALWMDCAHSIVNRKGYKFEVEKLDQEVLKKHLIA